MHARTLHYPSRKILSLIARSHTAPYDFRIFHVAWSGDLTLENLTVWQGSLPAGPPPFPMPGRGGGIFNAGTLTLSNSTVSESLATYGGGIFNQDGTLTLTNSTVSGNSAAGQGGGILMLGGALALTNSTVSGNEAGNGGGIYIEFGELTVTNCTVSGNSGRGIYNFEGGIVMLINSTVSGNSSGGILNEGGDLTLTNSIVANSSSGADCETWDVGVNDNGFNIVEDGSCGFLPAGDPNLGPLADNSGPTKTHALLPGSIAIDAIDDPAACTVTTDQRGVSRPQDPFCDIGSFEVDGCGNGILEDGEDCDDGNFNDGDCCSSTCTFEPGGAACDDGDTNTINDACDGTGICAGQACVAGPYDIADGDVADLMFAIACANILPDDTINLAEGGTYTLTDVDNDTDGPNGLPSVTSEITINGNGATIARSGADGTPIFRILHIDDPGNLLLNNLTVAGGAAAGEYPENAGGGIFNASGPLTLTDSTASGNSAVYGGGIYTEGPLTLTNSTVNGNSADYGGGISNGGTLTLSNSTVSGNEASVAGGGISSGGTLTLSDSTVSGNSATDQGGGIYSGAGSSLTMNNSTVSENSGGIGGGILNYRGTLVLTDSSVSGNSATGAGGGIFNDHFLSTLMLTNSTVSGNIANGDGGGIYNEFALLTLTNSTVSGNSAGGQGGGIYRHGSFSFGSVTLINSTVSGNEASDTGGGINSSGWNTLTLTNSTVSGNSAGGQGGGIWNSAEATLTLTNCIVGNSPSGGDCFSESSVNDQGYNIVEDGSCINDPTSMSGDPDLGPLADNGGPTQTHALLPGSIAIDEIPLENCEMDSDQRGMPRPQGDHCDIGSFEYELEICPADFDGDGIVNAADLAQLLGSWGPYGPCPPYAAANFNEDCVVNAADLAQLLGSWGPCE